MPSASFVLRIACRVFLCRRRWALVLLLGGGLNLCPPTAPPASAQADTTTAQTRLAEDHSPNSALWRTAVVPGWGQLYNRQYLKIPLVYGGLAGFTAAALYTNDRYLLYRHAYLFTARENADGSPVFPEYVDDYARLLDDLGLSPESEPLTEEAMPSQPAGTPVNGGISAKSNNVEVKIRKPRGRASIVEGTASN